MNKFALLSTAALLLVLSIPAQAQTRFGVRAGVTDGDPMIGGELLVPLRSQFVFNPTVELTSKLFTANADFHYDFPVNRRSSWWLGAGVAYVKPEHIDGDVGISFLGGYGTRYRDVYPYAQARVTSASDIDTFVSVAVGLRF